MLNTSLLVVVVGVVDPPLMLAAAGALGGIALLWLVKIQGEIHLLSQGSRLCRHLIPSWLAGVVLVLLLPPQVAAAPYPRRLASQPRAAVGGGVGLVVRL